uniref:ANK_REP_REGION domain-containing protein n=1 Tax=Elaeophora elaphi TaxID=1147741 RepID=A0A0R3RJC3_9BILA
MDVIRVKEADDLERIEAFLDAAYKADYQTISNNLAYGLSADVMDDDHTTALQIASAQGNLPVMQMLLNCGASVDKCNHCGFTPLLHAARNGKAEAIQLLIRHGADPFRTTFYGTTAFSLACAGGHLNVMAMLREYVSQTRRRAPTPLIAAIAAKQYQTVIHLQFAGIIKHPCRDIFYDLDAFRVAEQLLDIKMIVLLRDLGLQLSNQSASLAKLTNHTSQESQAVETPRNIVDIRCLIRDHHVALVDWIMSLNDFSGLAPGTTPLMYAAIVGNVTMVRTLLKHNCDINATYCGFTPIMIAIVCGNDALTQYLIKKGASLSTNGCQFSLFELAFNSDGISSATIQLLLTGAERKMRLVERMSAILQKISRRRAMSQSMAHQPVQLETNANQLNFLQKVVQNMGSKSNLVPEELFDALTWPDYPCTCFEANNALCNTVATSNSLLDERIMVSVDEAEQHRCLLSDRLNKRLRKEHSPNRSSNLEAPLSSINASRQKCSSSISRLQSSLFHFGSELPKNISYSTTSSNLSTMLNSNGWQDSEIPVIQSINELCSTYKYEKKYWDLLNKRCSPDMCQKLEEQEVDYETFLMLTKSEFISFGINRSDARILCNIQKILKNELSKI